MGRLPLVIVLALLCLPLCIQAQESNAQVRGGGSVVMEMSTAVWCDICADHEEWLPAMVDSNGERLIRVNLHSSIDDPLGNEASNFRKSWLGYTDADSTPAYHFDGLREQTPSSSRGELQRSLLDAEADRMRHEILDMSISFDSTSVFIQATIDNPIQINSTSMTLMLLEKRASISPEDATNGKLISNSVLKNIISVNQNESVMYPYEWASAEFESNSGIVSNFSFDWPDNLDSNTTEIVLIHEKSISDGERTTLSALAWSVDEFESNQSTSLWIPLIVISFAVAAIVYSTRRN